MSRSLLSTLRTPVREPMYPVAWRARLLRPYRVRRFHGFGARSVLHRPLWVYGPQQIEIGHDVTILHNAWVSVEKPAWELPAPVLRIGDRVGIRPFCTLSAAERITIEEDVVLSSFCTVVDSDHTVGENANVLWNPLETTAIRIGAGSWIGERTAVLRGSDIGRGCVIGANSVVRGAIPDHSVAVGAPARVVGSTRAR